jgi:5'-methylthioadenosine phosphorylase
MADLTPEVAVIGGSGFYRYLEEATAVERATPYGPPAAPITVGVLAGRAVAFLPRHGLAHQLAPHQVNYRANLWALRELGVRRIFGPCAAGSLSPSIHPGELVVLDQLVDRTWGRHDTYLDGPVVGHVSFADPYCSELADLLVRTNRALPGAPVIHPSGTVVVVQGPRFSTRAESRWYRSAGWDVINMTQYPEAYLARELGICYSGLALVTDYDTGVGDGDDVPPVTMEAVLEVLARDVDATRNLLLAAIPRIPTEAGCSCHEGVAASPLRRSAR